MTEKQLFNECNYKGLCTNAKREICVKCIEECKKYHDLDEVDKQHLQSIRDSARIKIDG